MSDDGYVPGACAAKIRARGFDFAEARRRKLAELDEGALWSFLRTVLGQGVDIALDAGRLGWSYEMRSARLDAAAAERAEQLMARLKPPNVRGNRPDTAAQE